MVDRWRGMLGRVNDGVAPGKGYRDFLSCFGIPVSEFKLTYWCDGLIDEISVWGGKGRRDRLDSLTATVLFICRTITQPSPRYAPSTRLCSVPLLLHRKGYHFVVLASKPGVEANGDFCDQH